MFTTISPLPNLPNLYNTATVSVDIIIIAAVLIAVEERIAILVAVHEWIIAAVLKAVFEEVKVLFFLQVQVRASLLGALDRRARHWHTRRLHVLSIVYASLLSWFHFSVSREPVRVAHR